MVKRNRSQVDIPTPSPIHKKTKTENNNISTPLTREEVDKFMNHLRESAEKARTEKAKDLESFQREIDQLVSDFSYEIRNLNDNNVFTRTDFKKIESQFVKSFKKILAYKEEILSKNKHLPSSFYLRNKCKIIAQILRATQTPLGKLVQERHPKFRDVVNGKIEEFKNLSILHKEKGVKEVDDLRWYVNSIKRD